MTQVFVVPPPALRAAGNKYVCTKTILSRQGHQGLDSPPSGVLFAERPGRRPQLCRRLPTQHACHGQEGEASRQRYTGGSQF